MQTVNKCSRNTCYSVFSVTIEEGYFEHGNFEFENGNFEKQSGELKTKGELKGIKLN